MKKLFFLVSIILCAAMLTAPFSAAETPDAYTLYNLATKHMEEATSLELIAASRITSEYAGDAPEEIKSTTTAKYVKASDGTPQMEWHTTYDRWPDQDNYTYWKDGYVYRQIGDSKVKSKMTDYDSVSIITSLGLGYSRDKIKDLTAETLPGGGYKLRLKADGYKSDSLRISDTVYIMTLSSDAQLETVAYANSFSFLENGKVRDKITLNEGTRVLSLNQPLKINFPPDLDTYVE